MAVGQGLVEVMGAPGFDDAPEVTLVSGSGQMKPITFIYPYYENPAFLRLQLELWSSYWAPLARNLHVIVVDDGSPQHPAYDVLKGQRVPFRLQLFRIVVDVRWNWLAARNIGMSMADRGGWCLLTDMDHMVPEVTAMRLSTCEHDPQVIYRLQRTEFKSHVRIHPHPNSMFMTREMFWRVGGYDEALSGYYGTDGDWRRRCAATARILTLSDELERHEYWCDSSTTHYKRKQPEDAAKKAIIARRGPDWRPRVLSFPYVHQVLL